MSTNTQNERIPLSVGLRKSMPQIGAFLAQAFGNDPNLLENVASKVNTYEVLLKYLQLPANAAKRNYGLSLVVSKKVSDRGALTGFLLYVRNQKKDDIMVLGFDSKKILFNVRGLYLDSSDETATRADPEAFKLHLEDVGFEKFFRAALEAFGEPSDERGKEAYKRSMAVLSEALSERAINRKKLNARVPEFQNFLATVEGKYDAQNGRTKMLTGAGVAANGNVVQDIIGVRYKGDGFLLEIAADYVVLVFAFGAVCVGKNVSQFDAKKLVHAVRKEGKGSGYTARVMKALMAFESFSVECSRAEAARRRMLRLMLCRPEVTRLEVQSTQSAA